MVEFVQADSLVEYTLGLGLLLSFVDNKRCKNVYSGKMEQMKDLKCKFPNDPED